MVNLLPLVKGNGGVGKVDWQEVSTAFVLLGKSTSPCQWRIIIIITFRLFASPQMVFLKEQVCAGHTFYISSQTQLLDRLVWSPWQPLQLYNWYQYGPCLLQRTDHNTRNSMPYPLRIVHRHGAYISLSLSEKTRGSNHLLMSLHRQHSLLS